MGKWIVLQAILNDLLSSPPAGRRLPGGLALAYSERGNTCHLVLSRAGNVWPSAKETEVVIGCLDQLGVGAASIARRMDQTQDGRHRLVRLEWTKAVQLDLFQRQ